MLNPTEIETLIEKRLSALSLEQKVRLVSGTGFWTVGPEPDAGLTRTVLSDGPAGVRGERWDERDPSLNVPTPISLAATWDPDRIEAIAGLLAADARRKGVHVLLAPAINLHRSPAGGRNFEYFSEDPILTGSLAATFVRGLQKFGVAATLKHFVANDSETDRFVVDVLPDPRALREVYLAPFEDGVAAGAWAVMAAYNLVDGIPMSEHPILTEILRQEWEFDGVVMSDWYAVRTVEASASAGLDLAMPGPRTPWSDGEALAEAVRTGRVREADIHEKARRILRLAARVGTLDGAETVALPTPRKDAARELREAAADGMVLLKNGADGRPALPLRQEALGSIAVVGPAAATGRTLGGGSATVYPDYVVSPLQGIRAAVPGVEVDHAAALRFGTRHPLAPWEWFRTAEGPGLEVRFLGPDGRVLGTEHRRNTLFKWLGEFQPGVPRDQVATIEVWAEFVPPADGGYLIGCSGTGRFTLAVDDAVLFDELLAVVNSTDPIEALIRPPQRMAPVVVSNDCLPMEILLRHEVDHTALTSKVELDLTPPSGSEDAEFDAAVSLASYADVAVVVVGTDAEVETESMDRPALSLPGRQDALVREVAKVARRTLVVINSGAPVLLPWIDEVDAVLVSWFPGQEFGNALADVLFGAVEPGGRLPLTWPAAWGVHQPSTTPIGGILHYPEGLEVGYRSTARIPETAFSFGHGLGYTDWSVEAPEASWAEDGDVRVRVRARNIGQRAGKHVAQLYASAPASKQVRPHQWLVGWATLRAEAGQHAEVDVIIPRRRLEHWEVENGVFELESTGFTITHRASAAGSGLSAHLAFNTRPEGVVDEHGH